MYKLTIRFPDRLLHVVKKIALEYKGLLDRETHWPRQQRRELVWLFPRPQLFDAFLHWTQNYSDIEIVDNE